MEVYYSLIIFCFVGSITPGPNNIMIMNSAINYGIYRSLPHYLGICFGFAFMLLAFGFGLGVIFINYVILHKIVKIIGSIYLLYLAFKIMTLDPKIEAKTVNIRKPITFIQSVLFQWTNPKAFILAINVFAIFNFKNMLVSTQVLLITVVNFIILIFSTGCWLLGGALIKKILQNYNHVKVFNISMGLLLILSIGLIYLE